MALLDAAAVKEFVRELQGSTALDTLAAQVGLEAQALISAYLGWPPKTAGGAPDCESGTFMLYTHLGAAKIRRLDSTRLRFPVRPVTAVASVYDSSDRTYGAGDLVASSDYTLLGDEGLLVLAGGAVHSAWGSTLGAIKATVTAGYTSIAASHPLLYQAMGGLAARIYADRHAGGVTQASRGGGSETRPPIDIPEGIRRQLQAYRLHRSPYDPAFPRAWERQRPKANDQ